MIRIFAFRDARKTDPKMVTLSLTLVSSPTLLEVITASDPTSADTYNPPPSFKPLMDHSTHKHTHRRGFFFPCFCPLQPATSSNRKPQFPLLLLLLWAPYSPFLLIFISSLFAFFALLTFTASLSLYVNIPPSLLSHLMLCFML